MPPDAPPYRTAVGRNLQYPEPIALSPPPSVLVSPPRRKVISTSSPGLAACNRGIQSSTLPIFVPFQEVITSPASSPASAAVVPGKTLSTGTPDPSVV